MRHIASITLQTSPVSSLSMTIFPPDEILPSISVRAIRVSALLCRNLLRGRAPKTGSYPFSIIYSLAASVNSSESIFSSSLFASSPIIMSVILMRSPFESGLKNIVSSSLLRNSGRKRRLSSALTPSLASLLTLPSASIPFSRYSEPRFEVSIIIVFLKSTVLP